MVVQACRWRDIDGVICALPRSDGAQYCPAHTLWVARSQCHGCGAPSIGPFCQYHQEPVKPEVKVLKRTYYILNDQRSGICGTGYDFEWVKQEAGRLARCNPGTKYFVVQTLAAVVLPISHEPIWEQVAP